MSAVHLLRSFWCVMLLVTFVPHSRADETQSTRIVAGPFSLTVPARWAEGAIVTKRAIQPVYTPEAWKAYKADPLYILKPDYSNRPTHWAIEFPKLVLTGDDATAPLILIHRTAEWDAASKDGRVDEVAVKKMTKELRKMVEDQDPTKSPEFMDAELHFVIEKRKLQFTGGHGFRVLAQWTIEPDLATKGRLHYLFFGMSDDNSCQIIATFPIDLPGLPEEDSKADHLGFSTARYEELSRQFPEYEQAARKWLTENVAKSKPSLAELDATMSSLVVRQWK